MKTSRIIATLVTGLAVVSAFFQPQPALGLPAPGDEHWATGFGPAGTDDALWSVVVKDGKVYVGGVQFQAGNVRANYISGYDGTNWFALNNGVQGDINTTFVFALEKDAKYLYVGGWFTNMDNCGARNIARWDGTNWSRMGESNTLAGFVTSLKWLGTNLYAGGVFYSTNGLYTCLARWAGTNWVLIQGDFTGGLSPGIASITSDGTNLFVCGAFNSVNGINTTNVAGWNGSSWFGLGNGIPGAGKVFWQNNKLYAGGSFTNAGILCTNLAAWNGSSWSAFGNPNRAVQAIAGDGTNLYVSGQFINIGGIAAKAIARWDGADWFPLGAGIRWAASGLPDVRGLAFDASGKLYAAGALVLAGETAAANIACWDGLNWSCLGCDTSKGLDYPFGQVRSFLYDGTDLYAGGTFAEAGGAIVGGIARWDGTDWNALGNGVTNTFLAFTTPPTVSAIAKIGSDIYIGGNFTNASGTPAKGIAVWNGSGWFNFGDVDSTVSALLYDGQYLWVGGSFTNVIGSYSPGLALFQPGVGWFSFGPVTGGNATVNALSMDELGNVYVGGNFTAIGGVNFTNIAMYNVYSFGWTILGNGVNNTVSAILATNGIAYVGGRFTTANGGTTVNRITEWNGAMWTALGSGATGTASSTSVNAIALRGTNLYIAGSFTNAGSVVAAGIAKWDGTTWSTLGSGMIMDPGSGNVNALKFVGDDLYVGGQFIYAGDKPSMFIARWNEQQNFYPPPHLQLTKWASLTNGQFQFRVAGTSGERYTIQASTNLLTWAPILTNTATLYDFTDRTATNFPARVYRAVLGP